MKVVASVPWPEDDSPGARNRFRKSDRYSSAYSQAKQRIRPLRTFDTGGKRILLPMADIPTIPGELFAKFQTSFYADPVDAVFKAMGVQ